MATGVPNSWWAMRPVRFRWCAKTTDGQLSCVTWYPAGHRFTVPERKAALAQYAQRLGLAEARFRAGQAWDASCAAAVKLVQTDDVEPAAAAAPRLSALASITARLLTLYVPAVSAPAVPAVPSGAGDGRVRRFLCRLPGRP